jgi:hypothetical protein
MNYQAEFNSFVDSLTSSDIQKELQFQIYGNHDASWLAFLDVVSHLDDIKEKEKIYPLLELAKQCGWSNCYEDFVVLQDRPEKITFNDDNLLHNINGPSIKYRDGFTVYSYNGRRIPARIITDQKSLTVEKIQNEPNSEYRRIMREIYGEGKYLQDSKAKLIDADCEGARKGAAYRCLLEDSEGRRFLVGTDGSTTRTYYMEVDAEITTCKKAHENLSGFNEELIVNKS